MSWITIYAYAGIAVFGFLMLWRLVKMLFQGAVFIPDVSGDPAVSIFPFVFSKVVYVVTIFTACLIAWPVVVYLFIITPKDWGK